MTDLSNLIENFWAGKITQAEKQLLMTMLSEKEDDFSEEEYKVFTSLINERETLQNKKDPQLKKLFSEIERKLSISKEQTPVYDIQRRKKWMWVAAAAVIVFCASTWWFITATNKNKELANSQEPKWLIINNNTDTIKNTLLADGSLIKIYPGSYISFVDGFKEKVREVKMNGKALFKVAKDTASPFIVYAGGFTTKALGTEFEISTQQANKFLITLLEGKVVIKTENAVTNPMDDAYLLPGETLVYDLAIKKAEVNKQADQQELTATNDDKTIKGKAAELNQAEIVFTRLPLEIVLQQIETEFGVTIVYDPEKVKDKEYSGAFKKADNPMNVLKKIAKQFGLKVSKEYGGYKVE